MLYNLRFEEFEALYRRLDENLYGNWDYFQLSDIWEHLSALPNESGQAFGIFDYIRFEITEYASAKEAAEELFVEEFDSEAEAREALEEFGTQIISERDTVIVEVAG